MKTHKKKKSVKMRGRGMGSHGKGARKKGKGKGHRGGKGLAGTGKRADHKKTLVLKKFGNKYFGKKGITSRKTQKDKRKRINISTICMNIESYGRKKGDMWEINLKGYKLLGKGNPDKKIRISVDSASKAAIDKIKKSGGEVVAGNSKK